MMESCKDDMAWNPVKWNKTLRSDASISEIVLWDIRPAGEFSKFFIQSKTSDNRTKTIGGETWRVYVRGPSKLSATVIDHHNGIYEALFLIMEPGVYTLTINLDYSLCDGFRDPPHDWFSKGNTDGKFQDVSMLGRPLDHKLYGQFEKTITVPEAELNLSLVDKLKDLETCSRSCNHLWDAFGRWTNDLWRPYLQESYNWSLPGSYNRSGTLWIYGDSLGRNLFDHVTNLPLCNDLYTGCQLSYNGIYLKEREKKPIVFDDFDFRPHIVVENILDVVRKPEMQREDSVLLLHIGLHFPVSINFSTYQNLVDDIIGNLTETEVNSPGQRVPKYRAKVIWKTSAAVHHGKTSNFLTTQRVLHFSAYALSAMCQAGFEVIDVHPLTAANPEGLLDAVHYKDIVFESLEAMLAEYKTVNNTALNTDPRETRIKQCISGRELV